MSQTLYDLPEGWVWKRLGSVCTFENGDRGKNYPSRDAFVDSGVAVINAGALNGKTLDDAELNFITRERFELLGSGKVKRGDLLFCLRGSLGKCAIVTNLDEGAIASSLVIVRPTESLLAEYLLNYFNSGLVVQFITKYNNGAAQPNLSAANLAKFELPLPPLAEQTRIVEKLDSVLSRIDTAIDELQQSLELVDAMFKSGLDKAFNPLGSPTNEACLYDLPDGWGWKQLHHITDVVSGYAFKSEDFSSDIGIPSVKITNVGLGAFVESQDDYLPNEFSITYNKFSVKEGDIVIALTRPVINGGLKVCRVPKNYAGALVNQRVAAVMCNQGAVLDYVYWYLLSPMTLDYVVEKSKSLNQPNLSIKDLSKLEVPLPPLSEQQQVVEALDALNDKTTQLKTELTAKIGMFNQLKASVLDGAFRGEV